LKSESVKSGNKVNKTPLGHVQLKNGAKAIYPMNDIFAMYMFQHPEHWEDLKQIVNLVIMAYIGVKPNTKLQLVEGDVTVLTQFQHMLDTNGKTTRDQDLKLLEFIGSATYVELQNRALTVVPIEIRSVEYYALGIGHSKGKLANQIWLLAEDVDSLLHGNIFARYILVDEVTSSEHPVTSGIMYVSLTKLSQQQGPAGELAAFLLGKNMNPTDKAVKKITDAFNTRFKTFKDDKEVAMALSIADRYMFDGRAEGRAELMERLEELMEDGYSFKDAMRIAKEENPEEYHVD